MIPTDGTAVNCASCHNTMVVDTLNWNPSAYEIALKYKEKSIEDLGRVLSNPTGKVMSKAHEGIERTTGEVELLKAYMDVISERGLREKKPVITQRLLFILALIFFFGAITDLIITKKVPYRAVHLLVLLVAGFHLVETTVQEAIAIGRSKGYSPDQPIKFSHEIHAGQNRIACNYCHTTAEYSKSAGIPSANVCLNCHELIREGTNSGRWEIDKIHEVKESNTPVEWVRVYNLPDHAFFSHAQHVGVASLECRECHGAVEEMYRIEAVTDISMGWCIECHRETGVQFFDNEFYKEYERLHEQIKNGEKDAVTVEDVGGIECMKCHY